MYLWCAIIECAVKRCLIFEVLVLGKAKVDKHGNTFVRE